MSSRLFVLFAMISVTAAQQPQKKDAAEPREIAAAKTRVVEICTQLPGYAYYESGGSNCFHGIILETGLVATIYYGDPVRYGLKVENKRPRRYLKAQNGLVLLEVDTALFDPIPFATVERTEQLFIVGFDKTRRYAILPTESYSLTENEITTQNTLRSFVPGVALFTAKGELAGLQLGVTTPPPEFINSNFGRFLSALEVARARSGNTWVNISPPAPQ